jgi:hypothetical protein
MKNYLRVSHLKKPGERFFAPLNLIWRTKSLFIVYKCEECSVGHGVITALLHDIGSDGVGE